MTMKRLVLALLIVAFSAAYAEQELVAPIVTNPQLDAAVERVSSTLPEDDPNRANLLKLYGQSREALASYEESLASLETFRQARINAPGQTVVLQQELAVLKSADQPDFAASVSGFSRVEAGQKSQVTKVNWPRCKPASPKFAGRLTGCPRARRRSAKT